MSDRSADPASSTSFSGLACEALTVVGDGAPGLASEAAIRDKGAPDEEAAPPKSLRVLALLSMLHEPAAGSANRLFRGRPVLRWVLDRLGACGRLSAATILCWDDQAYAARAVAGDDAMVLAKGPRHPPAALDAVSAARRWADGWRGGLLGTCAFDIGFFGPWAQEAAGLARADAVALIDPAAGLIDSTLVDGLIDHAVRHEEQEICFLHAAPGLGSALLRVSLLERLAAGAGLGSHPGRLLHYYPAQVSREMLGGEACAPTPTTAARTVHSFTLSSQRQIHRLEAATKGPRMGNRSMFVPSSGIPGEARVGLAKLAAAPEAMDRRDFDATDELASAGVEEIVDLVNRHHRSGTVEAFDALPREVVLELNTWRASRPIYWPGRYREICRRAMSPSHARRVIDELSQLDDSRLTLAGVGDPLLAEGVFEIIEAARVAGLAVHLETDLLGVSSDAVRELARSGLDVVSVHLPALTLQTYATVMGVDRYREALGNIETFVRERAARQRAAPLLAPLFVKCAANLGEMEAWYDQWLQAAGSAVIIGPSAFGGLVPDVAVADMAPPRRRPCARLASRLTVLGDGQIVSCEQDVLGRQAVGRVGIDRLADVWKKNFGALRAMHLREAWAEGPLCAGCRDWHRP